MSPVHRAAPSTTTRIKTALAAGLAAVMAAAGLVAGGTAALAAPDDPAPITGHVGVRLDHDNDVEGAPAGSVIVTPYRLNEDGTTATKLATIAVGEDGAWTLPNAAPGKYAFYYDYVGPDENRVDEFSYAHANLDEVLAEADWAFREHSGDEPLEPQHVVEFGAVVLGVVMDGMSGDGLRNQKVELYRQFWDGSDYQEYVYASATTVADGGYRIDSVPSGSYTLRFAGGNGYAPQYLGGAASLNDAQFFGATETGWHDNTPEFHEYDAYLGLSGKITGTIKDSSGKALKGITVTAWKYDGNWDSWSQAESVTTNASGVYTFPALAEGQYRLEASGAVGTTSYAKAYYKNTRNWDDATEVEVQAGKTKSGVNFTLAKGGAVTGVVSLPGGGHPAQYDIEVGVCATPEWCRWSSDVSHTSYDPATGAYRIQGIPAGTYSVIARPWDGAYVPTFVGGATARQWESAPRVKVAAGATVTGQNIVLVEAATISGVVTDADGPVEGVEVLVYPDAKDFDEVQWNYQNAYTDPDGEYTVSGLEAGRYTVKAVPASASLASTWAGGVFSFKEAQRYDVEAGADLDGIDLSLVPAGGIEVTTLDTEANVVGDDGVQLELWRYRVAGGTAVDQVEWREVDATGVTTFEGLAPGEYAVSYPGTSSLYAASWYAGGTGPSSADRIVVSPGVVSPVEFELDRHAGYQGRVVDSDGNPVYAYVSLYSSESGYRGTETLDGYFSFSEVSEAPHTVTVEVIGDNTGLVRFTQYTAPAPSRNAEPVDLGEIEVARGGTISGKVLGSDGKPLKNVEIFANAYVDGDLWWYEYFHTGKDGAFTLTGLPVGAIYLEFDEWATGKYPRQGLGGSPQIELSDPVIIDSADDHVYREARLVAGGSISGTVKNKATGKPIQGVAVSAYTQGQQYPKFDETSKKGKYVIPGLEAGAYEVGFNSWGGNVPWNAYTADMRTVVLTDGQKVTINNSLSPRGKLAGKVTDTSGKALGDVAVRATKVGDGELVETWTASNGTYSMHLDAGTWSVQFRDEDDRYIAAFLGGSFAASKVTIANGKNVSGKNVTLSRTGGGSIAADFRATNTEDPTGYLVLERIEGGDVVSSIAYPAGAEEWNVYSRNCVLDDCMPLENVQPGTYQLRVRGYIVENWSVIAAYDEVVTPEFEVTAGTRTSLGTIDLGAPTAVREGQNTMIVSPEIVPTGDIKVGELLTVDEGEWKHPVSTFYYQWMRDGKAIPGATEDSYLLTPGDAGAIISVSVMPDGYGTSPVRLDLPVEKGDAPVLFAQPQITGQTASGKTIKVSTGEWDLPGLSFSYQWQRDGAPIAKATSASYKLTKSDVGADISVVVTARRAGFESASTEVFAAEVVPATAMKQTKASKVSTIADGWSVTAGTWSPSGASVSYEWFVWQDGVTPISVGTGPTMTDPDVRGIADPLTVRVTASKAGYTSTTVEYIARRGPKPVVTGDLTASSPMVGVPVELDWDAVEVTPSSATATYQWFKNATKISGATKATYTPKVADAGAALSVKVTLKDARHTAWTAADAITVTAGTVAAADVPVANGLAIIDDNRPYVGRTLKVDLGTWSPQPTTFTYQWMRDGVAISKATKATYKLVAADLGMEITVVVRGVLGTQSQVVTSDPVEVEAHGPVMLTEPVVSTPAKVGGKLSVTLGKWDIKPSSVSYQWLLNGAEIPGATKSTYTPVSRDLDERISVRVTAKASGMPASSYESADVTIELGAAPKSTKAPALTVAGKAATSTKLGKTVVASAGTWSATGIAYRYQWQVQHVGDDWVDIEGATTPSLFLDADEDTVFVAGSSYRVVVTAVRSGYETAVAYSKAVKVTG